MLTYEIIKTLHHELTTSKIPFRKNIPRWVVILRVVLGICLIYKGIDSLYSTVNNWKPYFANARSLQSVAYNCEFFALGAYYRDS